MRNLSVSVCMATFNGEKYIGEQIESIICQLKTQDELVISDDGSSDGTLRIIDSYLKKFSNIKVISGPRAGFALNFENAVKNSKGEIVFFSDQDDIWNSHKISDVCKAFETDCRITTVLHNMACFNEDISNLSGPIINYHHGQISNLLYSSYWGCCMAVRQDFIRKIMPFRRNCSGHDQLTGLITEKYGRAKFLNDVLVYHRLHSGNTSKKLSFTKKIKFRINIFQDYIYANEIFSKKKT